MIAAIYARKSTEQTRDVDHGASLQHTLNVLPETSIQSWNTTGSAGCSISMSGRRDHPVGRTMEHYELEDRTDHPPLVVSQGWPAPDVRSDGIYHYPPLRLAECATRSLELGSDVIRQPNGKPRIFADLFPWPNARFCKRLLSFGTPSSLLR
jgi:hypothetical protein